MTDSGMLSPCMVAVGEWRAPVPQKSRLQVPRRISREKVPCKHYGTASAAGPTGMDILGGGIEEKDTAVVIAASQVNAIPLEKVCDNFPFPGCPSRR